jgi:hypothetical protein
MWCITDEGKIIDPTIQQFDKPFRYEQMYEDKCDDPASTCEECFILFRGEGDVCSSCKYDEWIKANVPKNPEGECIKYSRKLAKAFPELSLTKGTCQIVGPYGSQHPQTHWWCVDPDGEIVDPTAHQFRKVWEYVALGGPSDPVSRCANCGDYFNGSGTICGESCHEEYVAYLNEV